MESNEYIQQEMFLISATGRGTTWESRRWVIRTDLTEYKIETLSPSRLYIPSLIDNFSSKRGTTTCRAGGKLD